jgi:hypothetical protein
LTGSGELRLDKSRSSDAAGFFWPFNHGHGFFLLLNVAGPSVFPACSLCWQP